MKNVLLGFGLAILLSACGTGNTPVVEDETDDVAETSDQTSESKVVAEPEDSVVEVEPEPVTEPDVPEDDGVVESKSIDMDFSTCVMQQATFADAILSSGNYKVIPIVDTDILSMVRFCTNDGSVLHTCSEPDGKAVITRTTNMDGC